MICTAVAAAVAAAAAAVALRLTLLYTIIQGLEAISLDDCSKFFHHGRSHSPKHLVDITSISALLVRPSALPIPPIHILFDGSDAVLPPPDQRC